MGGRPKLTPSWIRWGRPIVSKMLPRERREDRGWACSWLELDPILASLGGPPELMPAHQAVMLEVVVLACTSSLDAVWVGVV